MTVTVQEAADNIGRLVIYTPPSQSGDPRPEEEGTITGASMSYVFVDFGTGSRPACRPEDLTFSLNAIQKEK